AVLWQDIKFVFAISRIDRIIESAVRILQFDEEVSFPFGFLQGVADVVATFGQAEIVQRADAGQRIDCEHERVDELRAVVSDAVVIACFKMAAGDGRRALVNEWKKLCGIVGEDGRGLSGVDVSGVVGNGLPCKSEGSYCVGWNGSGSDVI